MMRAAQWKRLRIPAGQILALVVCLATLIGTGCGGPAPEPAAPSPATEPAAEPAGTPAPPSDATAPAEAETSAAQQPKAPSMVLTEQPPQGGAPSQPGMELEMPQLPAVTTVSPEARPILDAMRTAYKTMEAMQLEGQVTVAVTAGEKSEKQETKFTAAFQAPNKFRHEGDGDVAIGSEGTKAFIYSRSSSAFLRIDLENTERKIEAFPSEIVERLQTEDPAIFFALTDMAIEDVLGQGVQVAKAEDQTVDGKAYQVLSFVLPGEKGTSQMLVDPETHLLRRIVTDMSAAVQGMNVQKAELTIDYTATNTAPQFAPDQFNWTPPEGAKDVIAEMRRRQEAQVAEQLAKLRPLLGNPAPDFTLPGLDGQPVSLASQQGQVVVLDFWATWCGPCVGSLPKLAELGKKYAQGVKILAVNLKEPKEDVATFLQENPLDLTIVLDTEGTMLEKYLIGPIPQTVVIGKDGLVRKALIGSGNDEEIAAEIDAALAGKPIEIPPATEVPATEEPAAEAPASEAPASEGPASEGPATEAPAGLPPAGQTPAQP